MRILHTSDWHLGQHFYTQSRQEEHQAFIDWLVQQVCDHKVDAVLVCGDLFDTGAPPSYARELYNQFIVSLHRVNCHLIVLAGNHDSVAMLNESKPLLTHLDTHVVTHVTDELDSQVIVLPEGSKPGAIVCAVPFIRVRDVVKSQAGQSLKEKGEALSAAITMHYYNLYQRAKEKRQEIWEQSKRWLPIITTGHLTAMGVSHTDSVRDIYIGNLEGFDASGFPPADYIALGHIHRPQRVAKNDTIRYCGAPIALSFDELSRDKEVLLIHFDDLTNGNKQQTTPPPITATPTIEALTVPRFQAMEKLKGTLVEIEQQLDTLPTPESKSTWLSIELSAKEPLTDVQGKIQSLVEGRPVEVLQLRRLREKNVSLSSQNQQSLTELTPADVFEKRLNTEPLTGEEGEARKERIRTLFAQVVDEVVSGMDNA